MMMWEEDMHGMKELRREELRGWTDQGTLLDLVL